MEDNDFYGELPIEAPKFDYDEAGFPIELDRPIVFDPDGLDPHTELSSTFEAQELGLPGSGFYNVPTIYGGQIYNPDEQFEDIRRNVQEYTQRGFKFPNFPTVDEAVAAAQARSAYIGKLRQKELANAIERQRQQYVLKLLGY